MAVTIVKRLDKGEPLTPVEHDQNLQNLKEAIEALQALVGVVLNEDGSLKDGAVNGTSKVSDGVITLAKLNGALQTAVKIPAGSVVDFAGAAVPDGWLLCNGGAVSRATYAALYAAIGTTWGAGDGVTTFNLPNFAGRTTVGSGTGPADYRGSGNAALTPRGLADIDGAERHALSESELPKHDHSFKYSKGNADGNDFNVNEGLAGFGTPGTAGQGTVNTEEAGGDGTHNNMQPFAVVHKIIKT
jgi:microcystin-dependent protein